MKFFIPYVENAEQSDQIYQAIKTVAASSGWAVTGARIRRLEWTREGKSYTSAVGEPETRTGEEVVAILEASAYLVYTPHMGIVSGMPLIVSKDEVTLLELFED